MGAITNAEEDREQLAAVHRMEPEARRWIQHHLGNALAGAIGMLYIGRYAEAQESLDHAINDLRQITPPDERAELRRMNMQMMVKRGRRE